MKVDTHAHFMSRYYYERMAALPGVSTRPDHYGTMYIKDGNRVVSSNDAWFDWDHQLRDMDKKGFDMRLVLLSTPNLYIFPAKDQPEIAKRVNDETISLAKKYPDRFRALPSLPLGDVDASIEEIDCVAGASFGPALMEVHAIVGADHLMFGTDYPFVDIDTKPVDVLDLPANEKNAINGGNAAKVFGLQ